MTELKARYTDESLPAVARNVSFDDAVLIARQCFGELGRKTVFLWRQYNDAYWSGALEPTPVLYVPTSPYGHWVGCTVYDRNIYLMFPSATRTWSFVRGVLLHEMLHQYLRQMRLDTNHASTSWCVEIMRISKCFGKNIWAGKYGVQRVDGKPRRVNQPPPSTYRGQVLEQKEIARWPHTVGIEPPDLA